MNRKAVPEEKANTERWLYTYSDLMNNLLVLFMVMYIMSVVDLSKFERLAASFSKTFLGSVPEVSEDTDAQKLSIDDLSSIIASGAFGTNPPGGAAGATTSETAEGMTPEDTNEPAGGISAGETGTPPVQSATVGVTGMAATPAPNGSNGSTGSGIVLPPGTSAAPVLYYDMSVVPTTYEELFEKIGYLLQSSNYDDQVNVEKVNGAIYLRFREGVFFLPNSTVLKEGGYPILDNISKIILESYDLISEIDISGHTAKVNDGPPSKLNLFSWKLSQDRAFTVLKYLVQNCDVPQEKLSVTGYSSNHPIAEGNSEQYWAMNRRVEIRLAQKDGT
jgi:flagellar motor protein MotB